MVQENEKMMVERYQGELEDLPKCPKCKIPMMEEDTGTPEIPTWFECPKCGKTEEELEDENGEIGLRRYS